MNYKAGPELDARIAVEVMGWELHQGPLMIGQWKKGNTTCFDFALPKYSRDIAAAWEVVEWLCRPGQLVTFDIELVGGSYGASFSPPAPEERRPFTAEECDACVGYGETAPLAICFAALRTIENKET